MSKITETTYYNGLAIYSKDFEVGYNFTGSNYFSYGLNWMVPTTTPSATYVAVIKVYGTRAGDAQVLMIGCVSAEVTY